MTQEKYYGTILHWFNDMQRGTIMADIGQRIFADGLSLGAGYLAPQTGDRVCFNLDHSQQKPSAQNITLTERATPVEQKTTITITDWDFMQNGGFGTQEGNPTPIFILGQFLADQSRVPEIGDQFEGNLFQHENGQWMMVDVPPFYRHRNQNQNFRRPQLKRQRKQRFYLPSNRVLSKAFTSSIKHLNLKP